MKVTVSAPLRLAALATGIASVVTILRPEPADFPASGRVRATAAAPQRTPARDVTHAQVRPWSRAILPEPDVPKPALQAAALPAPATTRNSNSTPPLPPLPTAADAPNVKYLGRIIEDDKVQVFLAANGDPVALATGGVLDGRWRIESISEASVALRDLQSNETRSVTTDANAYAGAADGVAPVQIGLHYLASQPGIKQNDGQEHE
jgi:hypothetical protein